MKPILGIDPGQSGALAWVCDGALIEVVDMPTIEVRGKRKINAGALANIISKRDVEFVVIEAVHAMPKQGVSSSFNFGYGAGLLEGVCAALNYAVQMVPPAQWKRLASLPADKGACRQLAARHWPGAAHMFSRVKDDGRAEASLMARIYSLKKGD
jgi:crossover junction endodeoxyribonuclease RuvC